MLHFIVKGDIGMVIYVQFRIVKHRPNWMRPIKNMVYINKRYVLHYTFKRENTLPLKTTHSSGTWVEKQLRCA